MTQIKPYPFHNYYPEETPKSQIYLHYTAGYTAEGAINHWNTRLKGKGTVGTCDVIDRDGTIYQAFPHKYWAYHLGAVHEMPFMKNSTLLNKNSVGIEVVTLGLLKKIGEEYFNVDNQKVRPDTVIKLKENYRGFDYFHPLTEAQYTAIYERLNYYCEIYKIPKKDYSHGFGYLSEMAINGIPGIYCHSMVRFTKFDFPPLPKMIATLKALALEETPKQPTAPQEPTESQASTESKASIESKASTASIEKEKG